MTPRDLPVALMVLIGFVAVVPVWVHYTTTSEMPLQAAGILALTLPAAIALYITSWMRPSLSRPILGVFVLAGALMLAPQLWAMTDMAVSTVPAESLASLLLQAALPLIIIAFVASIGWRRLSEFKQ